MQQIFAVACRRCALAAALLLAASHAISADFNAANYGAKGDGVTKNTAAIQTAIDAAAKKGGTVVLPAGTYLTGSLFVKSGVTLRLDKDVTLLGSRDINDYPMMPTRIAGIEMSWPAALVNVYQQKNAAIVGQGTIDGDGKVFWDAYWALRKQYEPRGLRWASDYDARRPRLVQIFDSSAVKVGGGLLMRRAGFWTVHVCYSEDVAVDGLTIRNNEEGRGPSTDGIDIDSSRKVLVANADISVNDDAVVLKAGRDADGLRVNRPTEDVVVRDVIVRDSKGGIVFGSETSGGLSQHRGLQPDVRRKDAGRHPVQVRPHARRLGREPAPPRHHDEWHAGRHAHQHELESGLQLRQDP
jgi:polygalacturonase